MSVNKRNRIGGGQDHLETLVQGGGARPEPTRGQTVLRRQNITARGRGAWQEPPGGEAARREYFEAGLPDGVDQHLV
jgi:hypothetical protein